MKKPFFLVLLCVAAVPTCAILMGILPISTEVLRWDAETWRLLWPWAKVGAALGVANVLLRPLLRLLAAPIGCLTLGLSGWVIDVGLIYLAAYFVEGIMVPSLLYAILTAVIINVIAAVLDAR